MQTDLDDFDPLSTTTTRRMLKDAIKSRSPNVKVPENTSLGDLRLLYKEHIDPDLLLLPELQFVRNLHIVKVNDLKGHTIGHLRFALQCHASKVFIHSIGLHCPTCLDLYIQFVLEGEVDPDRLLESFHYSMITDMGLE